MSDHDPQARVVEQIYDALDAGDAERGLALAREAMGVDGEDPVLRFLAGVALVELDSPAAAVVELERAVELDPGDAEFRANLAFALFKGCRFEDAKRQAELALDADPDLPDALYVHGMTQERTGDRAAADHSFERAVELDPERFQRPVRVSLRAFEGHVQAAGELLPDEFRRRLDEVAVTVEELPDETILRETEPPLDPELLGLFVGTSLIERSVFAPGDLPARILLFKRNLERYAGDGSALREEIARTLHHELAHYLGFDEDEMAPMDLA